MLLNLCLGFHFQTALEALLDKHAGHQMKNHPGMSLDNDDDHDDDHDTDMEVGVEQQ